MHRATLAVVLVAGCGRIQFEDVARDRDADGFADEIDRCPDVEDDQHDEDADLIGDACDPCPHIAGTLDDADGDGVGDACDPRPDIAGEQIRAFVTFADAPAWTAAYRSVTTEQWAYENDTARIALLEDHVAFLTIASPPRGTDVRVETELVVDSMTPAFGNAVRNFAIIDNYDTSADTGLFFGAVYDYGPGPPVTPSILYVLNSFGNMTLAGAMLGPTFAYGEPYHLQYDRRGDRRSYVLEGIEGVRTMAAMRADEGGAIGIRTRGLTIAFRYVIVIY